MRSIAFSRSDDPVAQQSARLRAADFVRVRGTEEKPPAPRDIFVQAASRGVFVTWKNPASPKYRLIKGWRVYRGDEATLYQDIQDPSVKQTFVEASSGTTPPMINVFVSSVNSLGKESAKIQAQGKATAETGAPAMPSAPPGYTSEASAKPDNSARLELL